MSGFSLLEVALVVLAVGLVLGGMIRLLSIQNQYQVEQAEQARLEDIKKALIGFASVYGRLPCPDTDNDGREDPNSPVNQSKSCNLNGVGGASLGNDYNQQRRVAVGLLPYKDLGVSRNNYYGHPYQYVVTLHYADTENYALPRFRDPTAFPYKRENQSPKVSTRCHNPVKNVKRATFSFCSRGGVKIISKRAVPSNDPIIIQEDAPFAVISLGKKGERTTSAAQNIKYRLLASSGNQNTNSTSPNNATFIRNRTVVLSDATDSSFDHKVMWMSSPLFAMAVLEAGLVF